jgi:uncharacterized protein (TIGR00251 family)
MTEAKGPGGSCYKINGDRISLSVKAVPGSSKSLLGEIKEDRLKVKIAAAPEDGKANEELRAFLAKSLGCPKKDITLAAGERSRLKTLTLPLKVKDRLEAVLSGLLADLHKA